MRLTPCRRDTGVGVNLIQRINVSVVPAAEGRSGAYQIRSLHGVADGVGHDEAVLVPLAGIGAQLAEAVQLKQALELGGIHIFLVGKGSAAHVIIPRIAPEHLGAGLRHHDVGQLRMRFLDLIQDLVQTVIIRDGTDVNPHVVHNVLVHQKVIRSTILILADQAVELSVDRGSSHLGVGEGILQFIRCVREVIRDVEQLVVSRVAGQLALGIEVTGDIDGIGSHGQVDDLLEVSNFGIHQLDLPAVLLADIFVDRILHFLHRVLRIIRQRRDVQGQCHHAVIRHCRYCSDRSRGHCRCQDCRRKFLLFHLFSPFSPDCRPQASSRRATSEFRSGSSMDRIRLPLCVMNVFLVSDLIVIFRIRDRQAFCDPKYSFSDLSAGPGSDAGPHKKPLSLTVAALQTRRTRSAIYCLPGISINCFPVCSPRSFTVPDQVSRSST